MIRQPPENGEVAPAIGVSARGVFAVDMRFRVAAYPVFTAMILVAGSRRSGV
jgi:hypothetical protein